jgi:XTP/dITP diphosphohydrolase
MGIEILFASHNIHKVGEIKKLLPPKYSLIGLHDIKFTEEIPEPFDSYEENSIAKATLIFQRTGIRCFADDSGMEVDALGGRPGVLSARFSGAANNSEDNIKKVLTELGDEKNRTARFQSVIAYISTGENINVFKGTVEGRISYTPLGKGGFGYDPIFIPEGFEETFGQLPEEIKNKISHRAKAMQKFIEYLWKEPIV